jgi:hypothetical protein
VLAGCLGSLQLARHLVFRVGFYVRAPNSALPCIVSEKMLSKKIDTQKVEKLSLLYEDGKGTHDSWRLVAKMEMFGVEEEGRASLVCLLTMIP